MGRQAPVNPAAGAQASPTDRPVARSSVVANPKSSRDAAGAAARGAVPPASGDRAGDDPPIAVDLHRVQPGETLRTLAVTYYGDARFESLLRRHNRSITDPNRLRAGSVVRIPAAPSSDAAARSARRSPALVGTRDARRKESAAPNGSKIRTPPRTYRVKPGDSFYSIARDVLGDAGLWNELFELNKALVHGDAKLLQIGQVISLPPKSVRKSR
ncbi:MAG: LysM peptidoglycan-binding domain-containing protein [Phycisphaerae bacterium]